MTEYTNFVEDFPSRCMEILQMVEKQEILRKREVTLSLMVASAGLVIPFERLKPDGRWPHPSRDNKKFPDHASRLKKLMEENFLGSKLHPEKESKWSSGELKFLNDNPGTWNNPGDWPELNENNVIKKGKSVERILGDIRNALAHGNILTKGNPIELIIFISKAGENYNFISASPREFINFLEKWFEFLKENKILMDANKKVSK